MYFYLDAEEHNMEENAFCVFFRHEEKRSSCILLTTISIGERRREYRRI